MNKSFSGKSYLFVAIFVGVFSLFQLGGTAQVLEQSAVSSGIMLLENEKMQIRSSVGSKLFQVIKLEKEEKDSQPVSFEIYPNPSSENITVSTTNELEDAYWRINDASGKLLMRGSLPNTTETISIKKLTAGMYFLTVGGSNALGSTKKIMKSSHE